MKKKTKKRNHWKCSRCRKIYPMEKEFDGGMKIVKVVTLCERCVKKEKVRK